MRLRVDCEFMLSGPAAGEPGLWLGEQLSRVERKMYRAEVSREVRAIAFAQAGLSPVTSRVEVSSGRRNRSLIWIRIFDESGGSRVQAIDTSTVSIWKRYRGEPTLRLAPDLSEEDLERIAVGTTLRELGPFRSTLSVERMRSRKLRLSLNIDVPFETAGTYSQTAAAHLIVLQNGTILCRFPILVAELQ